MYIRRGIDYLRETFERRSAKIVRKLHPVSFMVHILFLFFLFFYSLTFLSIQWKVIIFELWLYSLYIRWTSVSLLFPLLIVNVSFWRCDWDVCHFFIDLQFFSTIHSQPHQRVVKIGVELVVNCNLRNFFFLKVRPSSPTTISEPQQIIPCTKRATLRVSSGSPTQ